MVCFGTTAVRTHIEFTAELLPICLSIHHPKMLQNPSHLGRHITILEKIHIRSPTFHLSLGHCNLPEPNVTVSAHEIMSASNSLSPPFIVGFCPDRVCCLPDREHLEWCLVIAHATQSGVTSRRGVRTQADLVVAYLIPNGSVEWPGFSTVSGRQGH